MVGRCWCRSSCELMLTFVRSSAQLSCQARGKANDKAVAYCPIRHPFFTPKPPCRRPKTRNRVGEFSPCRWTHCAYLSAPCRRKAHGTRTAAAVACYLGRSSCGVGTWRNSLRTPRSGSCCSSRRSSSIRYTSQQRAMYIRRMMIVYQPRPPPSPCRKIKFFNARLLRNHTRGYQYKSLRSVSEHSCSNGICSAPPVLAL